MLLYNRPHNAERVAHWANYYAIIFPANYIHPGCCGYSSTNARSNLALFPSPSVISSKKPNSASDEEIDPAGPREQIGIFHRTHPAVLPLSHRSLLPSSAPTSVVNSTLASIRTVDRKVSFGQHLSRETPFNIYVYIYLKRMYIYICIPFK